MISFFKKKKEQHKIIQKIIETKKKINEVSKELIIFNKKQSLTNLHIIKNIFFGKDLSFKLSVNLGNNNYDLHSSSSTIIKHPINKNQFIMNARLVNYYLDKQGDSINNYNCNLSFNKIIILDNYFNIVSEILLETDYIISTYIGIEDIRLFNFNNKIYFIGSAYNSNEQKIKIVSGEYQLGENKFSYKYISPSFQTTNNWEKNWVFLNNNNSLNVIYKWYPIQICKINYETQMLDLLEEKSNIPNFFSKFRGSTNGLEFDNKIFFITHFHRNYLNKKNYLHVFVVFDKNMNLLGYSEPFNFENLLVEYCIGLELTDNNNFIVLYSTLDKTTKLVVFRYSYIKGLIKFI